jgi:hypothetical protein
VLRRVLQIIKYLIIKEFNWGVLPSRPLVMVSLDGSAVHWELFTDSNSVFVHYKLEVSCWFSGAENWDNLSKAMYLIKNNTRQGESTLLVWGKYIFFYLQQISAAVVFAGIRNDFTWWISFYFSTFYNCSLSCPKWTSQMQYYLHSFSSSVSLINIAMTTLFPLKNRSCKLVWGKRKCRWMTQRSVAHDLGCTLQLPQET